MPASLHALAHTLIADTPSKLHTFLNVPLQFVLLAFILLLAMLELCHRSLQLRQLLLGRLLLLTTQSASPQYNARGPQNSECGHNTYIRQARYNTGLEGFFQLQLCWFTIAHATRATSEHMSHP